jgi:anaerobic selenocysteine-containing dehydrogenase
MPKDSATLPASVTIPLAELAGSAQEYPYLLYPYPSAALGDGRGASQPWLQEMPDPMTTASWDTWVEIHPQTVQALSLKREDVVKITSPQGSISAIVYPYSGIRPDVVAVPLGQGHSALGRYARDRGANVLSILASKTTADGELAWAATRVKIEVLGRQQVLPRTESNAGVDAANQDEKLPG